MERKHSGHLTSTRHLDRPGDSLPGAPDIEPGPPSVDSATARESSAPESRNPAPHPHRLSRNVLYLIWLASDTSTGLSDALAGFALPLLALMVTGSPAQAGVIGAVGMCLRVITTLAGGVLADRHNRIGLMMRGAVLGIAVTAVFTTFALTENLTFVLLLVVGVLINLRIGLFGMAGESAIKELVPSEAIGRAQAANQARDAAIGLAGGPLGGVLLAAGAWLVGAAMALCQLVSLITSAILRGSLRRSTTADPSPELNEPAAPSSGLAGDRAPIEAHDLGDGARSSDAHSGPERAAAGSPEEPHRRSMWADAKEGLLWLIRRPDLRGVLIASTIVNLGFNSGVTTVIYSLQLTGYSPERIGVATAIISAVMLVGALGGPFLVSRVKAGTLGLVGLSAVTLGMLVLSLVEGLPLVVTVLSLAVLLIPALNAGFIGYMVVATPSHLLGRVNSTSRVFALGAMPLAPLIAGFGLTWIGREGTLAIAAALCLVATAVTFGTASLRAIPKESDWEKHAASFG